MMGLRPFTGTELIPIPHPHPGSFRRQAALLRRQFLQDGGLPFTEVLTDGVIADALAAVGGWPDRILSPFVTLRVCLGHALGPDHSCRAAVARPNAHRVARGHTPCSARTGAYGRARKRLPEAFVSAAAYSVGRSLDAKARPGWRWEGRRVYLFDGTTVPMPDTPANQAAYPQVYNQKPGLGPPSPGSGRSRRWRAGPWWAWGSAGTPARAKAGSACSAGCGMPSPPRRRARGRPADGQLDDHPHAPRAGR